MKPGQAFRPRAVLAAIVIALALMADFGAPADDKDTQTQETAHAQGP